ncbi:MAG: hypothetical protein COT91_00700 [Candidatus Doudnabacteria bacterium CG10_big_fil_rev_8_21_14_0_10_41_10]|uniref:NodB homology domain-containing protein n=1 Tax=Candidatus Doudnabacteria bacterium CG10_big_fil_rev_8_21_14_0_10_41_10 TaxID=1974551 RepID=A0A2H0VER7_9BACT|nr:MAG: hypothetical protein COT91_00700 [Candidatus Doudnabacteria bacterium CG10_big_fil_rev_8_21_14_0_10_41_10]
MNRYIKSAIYRFLHSKKTERIFKIFFANKVFIENFQFGKETDRNFYFLITVDVEPGYVLKNGRNVWINEDSKAFVGVSHGLENILRVLQKYQVPATFFTTPQCFYENQKAVLATSTLYKLHKLGNEIGLHMHPREDDVLKNETGRDYTKTSSHYYSEEEISEMLSGARKVFRQKLGKEIEKSLTSFRWGNWGLSSQAVSALAKNGFLLDSSACPGISGHLGKERYYDWSKTRRLSPWELNKDDYQTVTGGNSGITEIPNSTFSVRGKIFRADPVLGHLFDLGFKKYYRKFSEEKRQVFFTSLTHSSEATDAEGGQSRTLENLDRVIGQAKKMGNVKFITASQARRIFGK